MRHDYTPDNNPMRAMVPALAVCAVWWGAVAGALYAVLSR